MTRARARQEQVQDEEEDAPSSATFDHSIDIEQQQQQHQEEEEEEEEKEEEDPPMSATFDDLGTAFARATGIAHPEPQPAEAVSVEVHPSPEPLQAQPLTQPSGGQPVAIDLTDDAAPTPSQAPTTGPFAMAAAKSRAKGRIKAVPAPPPPLPAQQEQQQKAAHDSWKQLFQLKARKSKTKPARPVSHVLPGLPTIPTPAAQPDPQRRSLQARAPLADRMRPTSLDDIVGQDGVLGPSTLLGRAMRQMEEAIQSKNVESAQRVLPSLVLYGPPGCGKTTIARLLGQLLGQLHTTRFVAISAAHARLSDVKELTEKAANAFRLHRRRTVLLVDEIHRFNKLQQDSFLSPVESGILILIAATTENPSFEINSALLSRCHVYQLALLDVPTIKTVLERALTDTVRGYGALGVEVVEAALWFIARNANGDARSALNLLEMAVQHAQSAHQQTPITLQEVRTALQQRGSFLYDKSGDEHFNTISALHKSMRGSDLDASLYWLGRMIEGGDKPLYIARRLIRFASEDIGLADAHALPLCVATYQACHFVGLPECTLALVQAVAYMARAPKSNALYAAYDRVVKAIRHSPTAPVPLHIRNAPTALMKKQQRDAGAQYVYPPADPQGARQQSYLPESIVRLGPFFVEDSKAGPSRAGRTQ